MSGIGRTAKKTQKKRHRTVHNGKAIVGVLGGSKSDFPILEKAGSILAELQIPYELLVVSAHRTPDRLFEYASTAPGRGIEVIIAGAGGAAHLPGMLAAKTHLPVIGVPIPTENLRGLDSLLSIVQMPKGVPVATVAIGGGENAGLASSTVSWNGALLTNVNYKVTSDFTLTVTNIGDVGPTNIVKCFQSGQTIPFSWNGGTCGATLAASASCTITVRYTSPGRKTGGDADNVVLTYDGTAVGRTSSKAITGTALPLATTISALYSNAANWNQYISYNSGAGADHLNLANTACAGTETGQNFNVCVHGGEFKQAALGTETTFQHIQQ